MNVILEPVNGKGLKIPVDKAIVFIGRHPDCDVIITRSRMISRKHCAIVQVNDELFIRDLGSTNGVKVNGQRVRKEGRFEVDDTLTIGDIEYLVKGTRPAQPERRNNRDHPQDARAAGATPRDNSSPQDFSLPYGNPYSQEVPVAIPGSPYSQELPIAIPEPESFETSDDTPDSLPLPRKPDLLRTDLEDGSHSESPHDPFH